MLHEEISETFTCEIKSKTAVAKTAFIKTHVLFASKPAAIPLQAWSGPEGSRRMRLPDFKTIGI